MAKRRIGPISREIRNICSDFSNGKINLDEFKNGVSEVIMRYHDHPGNVYQNVGMALFKWGQEKKINDIMKIADEIEPEIKKSFINWASYMYDTGWVRDARVQGKLSVTDEIMCPFCNPEKKYDVPTKLNACEKHLWVNDYWHKNIYKHI